MQLFLNWDYCQGFVEEETRRALVSEWFEPRVPWSKCTLCLAVTFPWGNSSNLCSLNTSGLLGRAVRSHCWQCCGADLPCPVLHSPEGRSSAGSCRAWRCPQPCDSSRCCAEEPGCVTDCFSWPKFQNGFHNFFFFIIIIPPFAAV